MWYRLGSYTFASGSATVTLTNTQSGQAVADAILFVPDAVGVLALDTATWHPPEAQTYDVYARWPARSTHTLQAVYTVNHAGGNTQKVWSQSDNGGQWNLLGQYSFANTAQGVTLQASIDAITVADAVRFVPTGASVTKATTTYFHVDHLGSPQMMTAADGSILWDAVYEPFGSATISTELIANPLRLPGQYFDAETGLHQNWHRDYDPSIGRYLQSDPIGLDGGLNTYSYVGGNPLRYVDRNGQNPIAIGIGIGAVVVIGGACVATGACDQFSQGISDLIDALGGDGPPDPETLDSV